jgi:heat shock protein HtpX
LIKRFEIGFEIPLGKISEYLSFIEGRVREWYKYTLNSIRIDGNKLLFSIKYGESIVEATLTGDFNPELTLSYDPSLPYEYILNIALNLNYFTNEFYSMVREGNLILVFVPGLPVVPIKLMSPFKRILYGIFTGSLAMMFAISLLVGVFFFLLMGYYAPLGIVSFQLILFLLSPKILSSLGDWPIDEAHGEIYIVSCHYPLNVFREITSKRWNEVIKVKEQIYRETFGRGVTPTPEIVSNVLKSFNLDCPVENIRVKHVSLYKLVVDVCGKLNVKPPKIVLSNTIIANAGVSGPSVSNALFIITSGLLYRLNDDEIEAVLGHELSHCIRRDPLALFVLSNLEYVSRVYILLSIVIFPLDLIYFLFALTMLFFIAKFFEARADLDSYMLLGSGDHLVNALIKIAFPSAFTERYKAYRLRSWLRWNPHPPVYFRILRLGSLGENLKFKHPLIQSIKDCVSGFISSF